MKRQIAISDIHGANRTFQALLETINFSKEDELFLLGDYVDRGPDSKGVIDTIWRLQKEGYDVKCLMGNHEVMALDALRSEKRISFFNAADPTFVGSFGVKRMSEVPAEYMDWMANLPTYFTIPGYILVHAGLDFRQMDGDPMGNKDVLLWIRDWYHTIDYDWLGNRVIVHGHTPQTHNTISYQVKHLHKDRVVGIDAGCTTISPMNARLCAFDLTHQIPHFFPNIDGKPGRE